MQEEILLNIGNPRQLETLYRRNRSAFKANFDALYPQLTGNLLAQAWHQRLNHSADASGWGTPPERLFVVVASLLAALLAKLPEILSLNETDYFVRNVGFIVFPFLIAWFAWKNRISPKTGMWLAGFMLMAAWFINTLPRTQPSDTLILSCLHLPLCLWWLLGVAFSGGTLRNNLSWPGFLRYNGELAVLTAVLLLAGGLTSGLTIALFQLIGWRIQPFYFTYVVVCGLAAVPIAGTFLAQTQPTLVSGVAPVIAKLFSPLALVMLVVYLAAMVFFGKNPYQDREFLLLFNALLIGVMALIFFSVAETTSTNRAQLVMLSLLAIVTVVVNGIALSAILFRISTGGLTPNRAAVLGANMLMLSHLIYIGAKLIRVLAQRTGLSAVSRSLALFLPFYAAWSGIVTFLFPLLFGFR